jgi:hypothetical protein
MSTDTKSAHTPGPWHVHENGYGVFFADSQTNGSVAKIADKECALANARLIAAAPELLETLESIVACAEASASTASWIPTAKAAIRKARGEQ